MLFVTVGRTGKLLKLMSCLTDVPGVARLFALYLFFRTVDRKLMKFGDDLMIYILKKINPIHPVLKGCHTLWSYR
jgi:hypothetical protein